ncbi:hypothetical protein IscW_ISCW018142 [Ixodes scapularis]|uniref:Uncharacterized protein n=1 Tax=Ixodes scapularis TaxID=6945 RepID=B7PE59_IXOSC|nr:hypothetical protein IscW_ISCW018142 [Ixodes scapularis]|eukprot:XP_002400070.1 hypothetical protein IscW_ISCW018142 [Ixodes scapularis]
MFLRSQLRSTFPEFLYARRVSRGSETGDVYRGGHVPLSAGCWSRSSEKRDFQPEYHLDTSW